MRRRPTVLVPKPTVRREDVHHRTLDVPDGRPCVLRKIESTRYGLGVSYEVLEHRRLRRECGGGMWTVWCPTNWTGLLADIEEVVWP